jgi:hypothetical protein
VPVGWGRVVVVPPDVGRDVPLGFRVRDVLVDVVFPTAPPPLATTLPGRPGLQ